MMKNTAKFLWDDAVFLLEKLKLSLLLFEKSTLAFAVKVRPRLIADFLL